MIADQIDMTFYSRADVASVGDDVLAILASDPLLAPQRWGDCEPYKLPFPSDEVRRLWQEEARRGVMLGSLGGERKRPFYVGTDAAFGFYPKCPFHTLHWSIAAEFLKRPNALARIESLFRRLAIAFRSWYARGNHFAEFERQHATYDYYEPTHKQTFPRWVLGRDPVHAIPGVYWLNYFGPECTRFIGADRLRALKPPAEPLGEGMLLKLAPSPLDVLAPDAISLTDSIRHQLGEDLFFDIRHPDRKTRSPTISLPPPVTISEPTTEIPCIADAAAFIAGAAERAAAWRRRNGLAVPGKPTFENARATLRLVEKELDPGLPDIRPEEPLADATAVLGQLILERLGGRWVIDEDGEPYIVTGRGEAVFPMMRILKRATDPDAHLNWWYRGLVDGTLPPPLKPEQVEPPQPPPEKGVRSRRRR